MTWRLSPDAPVPVGDLATLNAELGRDEAADALLAFGREPAHPLPETRFYIDLLYRGNAERAREALEEPA